MGPESIFLCPEAGLAVLGRAALSPDGPMGEEQSENDQET
jgi:hypothetical protein